MSFGSRPKGASGELEVCRLLEAWWRQLEPDCKFARTPGSGGWSTANNREAFGTAGDLVTTAKSFPFGVEIKRREGWTDRELLAGRKSPVWGWWKQCQKAAREMQKVPMLWFRRNHRKWLVMMPIRYATSGDLSVGKLVTCQTMKVGWPSPVHEWADLKVDPGALWPALWMGTHVLRAAPQNFFDFRSSSARPPEGSRKASRRSRAGAGGSSRGFSGSPGVT